MGENGRSWFYLTLWHGTPPEFTAEVDAQIGGIDRANIDIQTVEAAKAQIPTIEPVTTDISTRESVGIDVTTITEVVWGVG